MYHPVEPLYEEVRKHQTVSEATPRGARGVKDIERATELLSERQQTPLKDRTDLTKRDKKKIIDQTKATRQKSRRLEAQQMAKNDLEDAEEFMENIVEEVHGRFINEEDFRDTGLKGYKEFVDNYIAYRYEPLIEEYDEARYQTYDFDRNLIKKLRCRPGKKIASITLKSEK